MLKKMIRTVLMSTVASGALVFAAGCSEDIEGNEQTHPTYIKAKQAREAAKYQESADLMNSLLAKAPNSTFLHRELAQLYGDNLYDYHRAIYHYTRHKELSKSLSVEDQNAIMAYIATYKRKAAEEFLKSNPQFAPKQNSVDQTAVLAEKEREIEQLRDENAAKHNQYLELYSKYSEARKKLVEFAERRVNATPAPAERPAARRNDNVAPATPAVMDSGEYLTHTVQSGEYPSTIAAKYGVSVKKIMELNGLTEETSRRIKVGQTLKIPKK